MAIQIIDTNGIPTYLTDWNEVKAIGGDLNYIDYYTQNGSRHEGWKKESYATITTNNPNTDVEIRFKNAEEIYHHDTTDRISYSRYTGDDCTIDVSTYCDDYGYKASQDVTIDGSKTTFTFEEGTDVDSLQTSNTGTPLTVSAGVINYTPYEVDCIVYFNLNGFDPSDHFLEPDVKVKIHQQNISEVEVAEPNSAQTHFTAERGLLIEPFIGWGGAGRDNVDQLSKMWHSNVCLAYTIDGVRVGNSFNTDMSFNQSGQYLNPNDPLRPYSDYIHIEVYINLRNG